MSDAAQSILNQIWALPLEDQQTVANGLLDKLEGEEISVFDDPEYMAELYRRIEETAKSTADCVDVHEAVEQIRKKLLAKRQNAATVGSI